MGCRVATKKKQTSTDAKKRKFTFYPRPQNFKKSTKNKQMSTQIFEKFTFLFSSAFIYKRDVPIE